MVDPNKNWIHLHRNLLINHLWREETFTRGQAWVDLLLLANHTDGYITPRGIHITVKRGQVGYSVKQLAIRWKWSEGKVNRFFELLEQKMNMISLEKHGKNGAQNGAEKNCVSTLITITNYDFYQSGGAENESHTERKRSGNGAETETNKKVKKVKKEPIGQAVRFEICVAWNAFIEMRKLIKKPMTPYAMKLKVGALAKLQVEGHDPVAVLNQSIENNWQDIYPLKNKEPEPAKPEFQASDALKRKLAEYDK